VPAMYRVVAVVLLSGCLGALAGAFTPRVAYRLSVAWGQPALPGCAGCAALFGPGLAGWVRADSRCAGCGVSQGPRWWWTVPVGGLSAGLVAACAADNVWVLLVAVTLSVFGVLLAAIDLAVLRLPDPIVGWAAVLTMALLGLAAWTGDDWGSYGRALAGAVALLGSYGLLSFVSGGQVGLGDVKLAGVLGLLLGWFGWAAVLLGGLSAVLLNGMVAGTLLAFRRVGLRGSVPMGPSILAGALLALVLVQLALPKR
jgi:leader peptidase (prepilin peptidase) / N-methyltransferase